MLVNRNNFSTGAGIKPTVTEQQKISSPATEVASEGVSAFDPLWQCESVFLSGQCSSAADGIDLQYATHTAPPAFKQMNAKTNNAISRIFLDLVCTTIIMTLGESRHSDSGH
jgi:hypothetical protein